MPGDLLLVNGRVRTMDADQPTASAVAIRQGRIVAVGADDDVRRQASPGAETIDLAGRTATPGLNDAHCHPMGVGFALADLDLGPPSRSIEDLVSLVAAAARERPADRWIVGRGYDQARLVEGRHPTRQDLDHVAPDRPVLLIRACHHIGVANSTALALAGITAGTPDPEGGTIDRDETGQPTGVLRETAFEMVREAAGQPTEDEVAAALIRAGNAFLAHGVTSVAEAVVARPEEMLAYQRLRRQGQLPVRTSLMPLLDVFFESFSTAGIVSGLGDDRLRIGPLKLFADGSIGGHTARMRRPYEGEPDNFGLWMMDPDLLLEKIDRAHRAGFQLAIHAIGDAAIDLVVQGYEASMAKTPRPDPRHRIEHCGIPDEALLRRIAEIGAVALPGTSFLHFFLDAYETALGMDRLRYAIGMASFARFGIVAAANTDAPVVSLNPALGLRCMTTRLDSNDRLVWPEEAISLDDALLAYTANGACMTFEENEKGRLKPGMVGDVAVWETNLHAVEPTALGEVKVDLTVLDGDVVYQRDGA